MIRRTFDPNVHGRFTWPGTWRAEVDTALEQLAQTLDVRYPEARLIRSEDLSVVYALHDEEVVSVAWIEPEVVEGRVVGIERSSGGWRGRA